jgi:hypothetical protein
VKKTKKEKTFYESMTDEKLLYFMKNADPVEDPEIYTQTMAEVRRREEDENYNEFFVDFRDEQAEQSIIDGEKNNPLITYKCKHCKTESVYPKNKQGKLLCLKCKIILLGGHHANG